jgi:hypothetical protein
MSIDTIINSAAIVKHYSADEMIEYVNVHGVENLILCAREQGARLVHISTASIPGAHTEETYRQRLKMYEDDLFIIDSMNNKYLLSKSVGRYSDGEFQINSRTNAFLRGLSGFAAIGMCPASHATDPVRLSPIGLTAQAIVLLAGTGPQFTAFNVDNRYGFDEMQLIHACNHCGITIKPVDDEVYYNEYLRLLGDDQVNARLSGLITNDRPDLHLIETDNTFTANVLYRLGFSWPLMGVDYLARLINSLISLDFFEA